MQDQKKVNLLELFETCLNIEYEVVGSQVEYAFAEKKNKLYIYFQCSNELEDWRKNFDFCKKAYGLFKVHRGFFTAYYEVRNIILDKAYSKNYKEIIVVGYSHGAAIATICHQDICYHFPNVEVHTYAFEAPRSLKVPKKLRYFWDGLTRIINGTDLVTHVPPKIFGFNDLGNAYKIKGDTSLIKKHIPKCIKYHYPQVVVDGLLKKEEN